MKDVVFQALAEAARGGEPVALGIISGVEGSSPQKAGAKAVFHGDGRIGGTMGGGCLEAEIQQRALLSLGSGQGAAFELLLDNDFGWDDGLICGGKVRGLIVPNAQRAGEHFWSELAERKASLTWGVRPDFSIATLRQTGEAPHGPGGHLVQGQGAGEVRAEAGETPGPRPLGSGSRAPGKEQGPSAAAPSWPAAGWLYCETVAPRCALWIAGAGHIAQAVAPLALQLDFAVTVLDDRPGLANHEHFPPEVRLEAEVWEKLLGLPLPEVPCFGLIVTRGHRHDALVLANWVRKPFLFLGMIGSARKARTVFEHFREGKLATPEQLERVACPVGVRIRCQEVFEIAVSIMAQFIDKRAELARGVA